MKKITTRTGDQGKTSLLSGERLSKADERLEASGDVDELSSVLGLLAASLREVRPELAGEIEGVQSDLFLLGARLSATPGSPVLDDLEPVSEAHVAGLEEAAERIDGELPRPLGFIIPGGHGTAGLAHVARTVCRRAERRVIRLSESAGDGVSPTPLRDSIVYLNRLSDYLFQLARLCNKIHDVAETLWKT